MVTTTTIHASLVGAAGQLDRVRQSWAYDALMRLPVLLWAAALVLGSTITLQRYIDTADSMLPPLTYGVNVAMRVSTIAFCALILGSVVMRLRPAVRVRGVEPRFSALAGTFLAGALVFFPRCNLPLGAELASIALVAAGYTLASIALMQLGRSFSIMPEARELVTTGMYRFVRHPLYLAEQLATIGILVQFLSGWTLMVCIAQMAFQLRRMHHEEKVLAAAFPEYSVYRTRTARLLPGIY